MCMPARFCKLTNPYRSHVEGSYRTATARERNTGRCRRSRSKETALPNRDRKGVTMGLRPTKGDESLGQKQ
jgi:hypothetical protein